MKIVKFIWKLLLQMVVGIVSINILFFVATIRAAINGYPDVAKVKVDIKYGEKESKNENS